jgi:hypothetical protein
MPESISRDASALAKSAERLRYGSSPSPPGTHLWSPVQVLSRRRPQGLSDKRKLAEQSSGHHVRFLFPNRLLKLFPALLKFTPKLRDSPARYVEFFGYRRRLFSQSQQLGNRSILGRLLAQPGFDVQPRCCGFGRRKRLRFGQNLPPGYSRFVIPILEAEDPQPVSTGPMTQFPGVARPSDAAAVLPIPPCVPDDRGQ